MSFYCPARYLFVVVVSVLGIGQMIAACGQKGDLYLPEPEKEAPQQTATKVDPPPEVGVGEKQKTGEVPVVASDVPQPGQD